MQCPKAKPIIHLGATSCYVGDNTDIIVMTEATEDRVKRKLVNVIAQLSDFAQKYKAHADAGFYPFPAGTADNSRKTGNTLWITGITDGSGRSGVSCSDGMKLLGSKGTTGTQASFLELFDGDQETIDKIDPMIAQKMGFTGMCAGVWPDLFQKDRIRRVLNVLAGIAASAHKMSNDIRLLQHLKEVEEPFEKTQIGSSAMAYKRNPMRSERIASLSRYVIMRRFESGDHICMPVV